MKKAEYYLNTVSGVKNRKYPKVSGFVEAVADNKGYGILMIGYDKRSDGFWRATELNTGFMVSEGAFQTRQMCADNVHGNIDIIADIYNRRMMDGKYYNDWIKPFEDFVNANGGFVR